jgi:hypothetical protein
MSEDARDDHDSASEYALLAHVDSVATLLLVFAPGPRPGTVKRTLAIHDRRQ